MSDFDFNKKTLTTQLTINKILKGIQKPTQKITEK